MTVTKEWKSYMKSVFWLAVPIMIENTLQTLLGTTDTYFAGKLADQAIAGIGVTNLIMNIFISFFTAVSVGTTVVVSHSYGSKDYAQVNRAMTHSLVIGSALGILSGAICGIGNTSILRISGADSTVIEYVRPYFLIVLIPCVALCLQLILSAGLRAMKDTKTPMYVTGAANIVNIILNIVFIKWGWGIFGLGLATTLSRGISVCILFWRIKNYDAYIRISFCRLSKKETFDILKVGIPAGLEKLIMRIGQLVYNGMIITIGTSAYVAHQIAGSIENYSYIPSMGFGLAVCTLVGISLGEGDEKKAKKYQWQPMRFQAD